ncbi:hypothetical protein Emin_0619 [Elusimicrobium minutum Pei191]|uniref:Bax inhibitor-1/YccA family protein n=1 Tax=Elusimicrobium minutum (strain Pei191) TaxID=445932 RepID=B2KC47_ELUMP|nr:Bax inhibitor-1/YccA family protein [Elusimicrobium minutum]ACC98174.1 hypothetical protein Emin_0619 [Elusimicrobium minutum Pei191]
MKSSNPIFNEEGFKKAAEMQAASTQPMTISGAVNKSFTLLFICFIGALLSWSRPEPLLPWIWPISIGAFVIAMIVIFNKRTAPMLAPIYAFGQGIAVGLISLAYAQQYAGIVYQALGVSMTVFFIMLVLYKTRIIKVTSMVKSVIVAATAGVAVFYIIGMIMMLFGANWFYLSATPLSIGVSVVVCLIAAFNLLLDFDFIENAARYNMPKYMEWYAAFGLLITLIWMYLEILRLLGKLQRR